MHAPRPRPAGGPLALAALLVAAIGLQLPAQNVAPGAAGQPAAATPATKVIDPITHEGYIEPPEPLKRLVAAPRGSNVVYGTPSTPITRKYFLRTIAEPMPPLALMGKEHHNLAGWQIDNRANRARNLTTRSSQGFELYEWETGKTIKVELPAGARAMAPTWSPDGKTLAYFAILDDATHIFLADAATGKSRPLTRTSVLATNVTTFYWTGDGKSIVTVLIPDGRSPEPKPPAIATEPIVRVNEARTLRTRTFADLIGSPFEQRLLEYHMTGQLAVIDVKSRAVKKVGAPGMIRTINGSPDAMYFRVTYLDRPFSYYQQIGSFGTTEVLIDATGKVIRELNKRVMREGTPDSVPDDPPDPTDPNDSTTAGRGGGRAGGAAGGGRGGRGGQGAQGQGPQQPDTSRRSLTWHPYETGMMFYQLSPLPAGAQADSAGNARRTDRFMVMPNPADTTAVKVVYETPGRIQSVRFSDNGRILFVNETEGNRTSDVAVYLDENNAKFTISSQQGGRGGGGGGGGRGAGRGGGGGRGGQGGGGGGQGSLVSKTGSRGNSVVMISTDGKFVFTQGTGRAGGGGGAAGAGAGGGGAGGRGAGGAGADSTLGQRPYVEKIEIRTGTRTRIYQSESPLTEQVVAPLDDDFNRAIIRRESRTEPAQSFILDLRTKEAKQITSNKDLMPEIRNAIRKTVMARRADGLPIRIQLTLPADYKEGTRLPALFWFYPREFENAEAYTRGLNTGGRGGGAGGGAGAGTFPSYGPRTMAFVTTQGYALVEPDAPIVGDSGVLPNDRYVHDLQRSLYAVIDALDTLRYIDKNRLAIGGHSYGGFSTVNAMVHTPFFKAGIAGDGNYNRLLTPNGFQSERRTLWQARDTYLEMSPFLRLDQLSGALLLYHSTEDQNVGTDPINSPKLFHALQGLGKTVSMYMYPYEDHGPIAHETVLDQWARWVAWLDKYVKNHGQAPRPVMNEP